MVLGNICWVSEHDSANLEGSDGPKGLLITIFHFLLYIQEVILFCCIVSLSLFI